MTQLLGRAANVCEERVARSDAAFSQVVKGLCLRISNQFSASMQNARCRVYISSQAIHRY
jgi:hypothetical protein